MSNLKERLLRQRLDVESIRRGETRVVPQLLLEQFLKLWLWTECRADGDCGDDRDDQRQDEVGVDGGERGARDEVDEAERRWVLTSRVWIPRVHRFWKIGKFGENLARDRVTTRKNNEEEVGKTARNAFYRTFLTRRYKGIVAYKTDWSIFQYE